MSRERSVNEAESHVREGECRGKLIAVSFKWNIFESVFSGATEGKLVRHAEEIHVPETEVSPELSMISRPHINAEALRIAKYDKPVVKLKWQIRGIPKICEEMPKYGGRAQKEIITIIGMRPN